MKIVFAGTPEFAALALEALHGAGFEIPLVLTQPDRPAGRGMKQQASAVKRFAAAHGMRIAQPHSLKTDGKHADEARQALTLLRETPHEVMVVAAYGLILPPAVLAIPPQGCINIHASLLPRWRGAAPIQRAIEAGDTETGVTIMRMDEGLDTGAMLLEERLPIAPQESAGSLHDRLAALGARLIVDAMRRLQEGKLGPGIAQPASGVNYAAKISKQEAALDFAQPAALLARKIRAFDPVPGASAEFSGIPLKIWSAEALERPPGAAGMPGEICAAGESGIMVACGEGALRLLELQRPGGRRLPASEFIKGFPMTEGRFELLR